MKSLEDIGFGIRDFSIYFVLDLTYIILGLLGIVVAFFVLRALLKRFLRSKFLKKTLQKGRNLRSSLRKKDADEESDDEKENGSDSETKEEQE